MPRTSTLPRKALTTAARRRKKGEPVSRIAQEMGVNPATLRAALARVEGPPPGVPATLAEAVRVRQAQIADAAELRRRAHQAIDDAWEDSGLDPARVPAATIAERLGVTTGRLREVSDGFLRRRLTPYRGSKPGEAWPASDVVNAARAYLAGPGRADRSFRGFVTWVGRVPDAPNAKEIHAVLGSWPDAVREYRSTV